MGLGQVTHTHSTLSLIDYMAWISQFEFIMISMTPREIVSYTTLIRSFDMITWGFLVGSLFSSIILLIVIGFVTGQTNYMQKGKLE